ncbi:MAG: hypothetical protein EZS28_020053, partial [Streblomastix strix]
MTIGDICEMLSLQMKEQGELLHQCRANYAQVFTTMNDEKSRQGDIEGKLRTDLATRTQELEKTKLIFADMMAQITERHKNEVTQLEAEKARMKKKMSDTL